MPNNANRTKKYIVTNEQGEEFLLPNYPKRFLFGSAISRFSSRRMFSRTLGPFIANVISEREMPYRFSRKISILTPMASAAALGHKIMQA